MSPLILLTTGYYPAENGRTRRQLNQDYVESIRLAGGVPLLALGDPADASLLANRCDGLLLTGGFDVAPHRYGQEALPQCGEIDARRDEAELALFHAFRAAGKPIFGICRGIQLINIALGGTLWQDLPFQRGAEHSKCYHTVRCSPDSQIAGLFGQTITVNSYHHQAIGRLGEGLTVAAHSPDGVIEAVEHKTEPIFAVQWHPERMTGADRPDADGPDMLPLFEAFVRRCSVIPK